MPIFLLGTFHVVFFSIFLIMLVDIKRTGQTLQESKNIKDHLFARFKILSSLLTMLLLGLTAANIIAEAGVAAFIFCTLFGFLGGILALVFLKNLIKDLD